MTKVLVVYASRHGGTRGIAERIGDVLRTEGLDADVAAAEQVRDVRAADAFVVGSGLSAAVRRHNPPLRLTPRGRPRRRAASGPARP
jgi:menaquinone-dependent protoporphyrinogen IX oxidase